MRRNYQQKLSQEIISRNYYRKLSAEIITGNYDLVYYVAQKCVNYRDTGVSKNIRIDITYTIRTQMVYHVNVCYQFRILFDNHFFFKIIL